MKKRALVLSPRRTQRLEQLPSPTEKQLQKRESGWNDRFYYEQPLNSNKLPRADRTSGNSNNSPPRAPPGGGRSSSVKEKKIRDERQQYGNNSNNNNSIKRKARASSKQPANGRLQPLGHTPAATKLEPTKVEKLRQKALRAIDSRENALYQLSALILCTPVQETLFQPSRPTDPAPPSASATGSGFQRLRAKASMALAATPTLSSSRSSTGNSAGVMTNARDATKMAQKLAEDLQLAGIQCVEAIVAWMLEAGATADKPPAFVWRDRNYIVKMHTDLDFAQRELNVRGVHLECFTPQNPLLVRSNQKLGRVLAAQAIITEMVELATARVLATPSPSRRFEPVDHGFERQPDEEGGDGERQQQQQAAASGVEPEASVHKQQQQDDDDGYASDSDAGNAIAPTHPHALDASLADELVHILDESLSELKLPQDARDDRADALALLSVRSTSEYDNSFDGEEDDDNNVDDEEATTATENQSNHATDDRSDECDVQVDEDEALNSKEQTLRGQAPAQSQDDEREGETGVASPTASDKDVEDTSAAATRDDVVDNKADTNAAELQDKHQRQEPPEAAQPTHIDAIDDAAAQAVASAPSSSPYTLLQMELHRLARVAGADATAVERSIDVAACLAWDNSSALAAALARHEPIDAVLDGSLLSILVNYKLLPATASTRELLETSAAAAAVLLPTSLWRQCMCVLDSVYNFVASELNRLLEAENALVSEIEVDEAIAMTATTLVAVHAAVWPLVATAVAFLELVRSLDASSDSRDVSRSPRTSSGVSALVKVFYPYLIHLPRETLRVSWRRVSQAIGRSSGATPALALDALVFAMDPTCKALVLVAESSSAKTNAAGDASIDSDDDVAWRKLAFVCMRDNVLETSVTALWPKLFASSSSSCSNRCVLFPFFASPFGEKVVDGHRVEEGEGNGPLKEWIVLLARAIAATWSDAVLLGLEDATTTVDVYDNKLVVASSVVLLTVQPGDEVSWLVGEERVQRIVNKVEVNDGNNSTTLWLDRSVASQALAATNVRVRQPRHAFVEYVQASERFWLNAQTHDTPANRHVLRVFGWYLATALAHATTIELLLHPLVFTLLLDATYCVTLDDVRALDAGLFDALDALQTMAPADLTAFLALEGVDASVSIDTYIKQVVADKFGAAIAWQLTELRCGFCSVFAPLEVAAVGLSATELTAVVCGTAAAHNAIDADFCIDEIFRVARDAEFVACPPLERAFWRVVNAFAPALKRQFIQFVTGVDTLPLAGTEFLRIEMPFAALTPAEHAKTLHMLPQSHTCDNTLELPHYWRALCWQAGHDEHVASDALEDALATLLRTKLQHAIEYSSGYGLDATSAVAGVLSSSASSPHRQQQQQRSESAASRCAESYESLDLPAMGDDNGDMTERTDVTARAATPPALTMPSSSSRREEDGEQELRESARPASSMAPLSTPPPEQEQDDYDGAAASVDDREKVDKEEEKVDTVAAIAVPLAAAVANGSSPHKSPRHTHRGDVDESYGEGDWEDEEDVED